MPTLRGAFANGARGRVLLTLLLSLVLLAVRCGKLGGQAPLPVDLPLDGERVAIEGAPAPGPRQFNQVWVRMYGARNAQHVLVLVPGSPSGQGSFDALAPALAKLVPGLQVWTLDRRENAFEDVSVFEIGNADLSVQYYLFGQQVAGQTFAPVTDADASYVHQWGVNVAFGDLHNVVLAARDGGRRGVILGGHSMGAIQTPTYAVWDFAGVPGYADLEALVLIDGAPFGAFSEDLEGTAFENPWTSVADANAALVAFNSQSPFGFAGPPLPVPLWTVGVLPEIACQYALNDPNGFSALQLLDVFVLPILDVPPFPITNESFFGLVSTEGTVASFNVRTGQLAAAGSPRPWQNGVFSSVPYTCKTFTREPGNAMAWYYPVRIDMDLLLALPTLERTTITDFLSMRPFHLATLDLPLFVFQTSLSNGGVIAGAEKLVKASNIENVVMVSDEKMGHLDPLDDFPDQNTFIETVVPFLESIVR